METKLLSVCVRVHDDASEIVIKEIKRAMFEQLLEKAYQERLIPVAEEVEWRTERIPMWKQINIVLKTNAIVASKEYWEHFLRRSFEDEIRKQILKSREKIQGGMADDTADTYATS